MQNCNATKKMCDKFSSELNSNSQVTDFRNHNQQISVSPSQQIQVQQSTFFSPYQEPQFKQLTNSNSTHYSSPTSIDCQAYDEKSAVDLIKTYSELERTLDDALNKLDKQLMNDDKRNDLIPNEVDKSCNEIRESYLLDLQSLLHLMLKELEKICNHFIKRMYSTNKKQLKQNEKHKIRTKQELYGSTLNSPSSLISSSGADRTELVSYINNTINVIKQTGLSEFETKHSELVNDINMLLDGRKMKYFQQINDLTVFLAEKLLDSEKKIPDFNQDIKNLPKLTPSFNDKANSFKNTPFNPCYQSNIPVINHNNTSITSKIQCQPSIIQFQQLSQPKSTKKNQNLQN